MAAAEGLAGEVVALAKVCLVSSPYREKTEQHRSDKKPSYTEASMLLMTKRGFIVSH